MLASKDKMSRLSPIDDEHDFHVAPITQRDRRRTSTGKAPAVEVTSDFTLTPVGVVDGLPYLSASFRSHVSPIFFFHTEEAGWNLEFVLSHAKRSGHPPHMQSLLALEELSGVFGKAITVEEPRIDNGVLLAIVRGWLAETLDEKGASVLTSDRNAFVQESRKAKNKQTVTRTVVTKTVPAPKSKPKQKKKRNKSSQPAHVQSLSRHIRSDNPYLRTLVDPENSTGVRYPDSFDKKTGTFRGLLNFPIPYFTAEQAADVNEPEGSFLAVVTPTLMEPVMIFQADTMPGSGPYQCFTGCNAQNSQMGLLPLVEDTPTPSSTSGNMWLKVSSKMNLVAPFHWRDQDFSLPGFRGVRTADQTVFYGWPISFNSGDSIRISMTFAYPLATGESIHFYIVHQDAEIGTGSITAVGGEMSVDKTYTFPSGGLKTGRPGVGIRVLTSNFQSDKIVTGWSIKYETTDATQARFKTVELPNQDTYAATIDQYRVVSMSAWLAYEGSALKDGGQCSGIMYRGGRSPMHNSLYDYQSIAETPGGYEGPLKKGLFSWWRPSNDRDMLFRELQTEDKWMLPYIVFSGVVSEPDQVNALRLRVPINYEFVSTAQFYEYEHSPVMPAWISHAAAALADVPNTMENDSHWSKIQSVLRGAYNKALGFGKWVQNNSSWLVPAAGALLAL